MTNFECYKKTLQQEQFIKGMVLNCKGCPVEKCGFVGRTSQSITCEDVLKEWCNTERYESGGDEMTGEEILEIARERLGYSDDTDEEDLDWLFEVS